MNQKSKTTALVLCIFLGWLGVHRFYVGKTGTGILWLLTWGIGGIGWFIDLFLVGGMVDEYNMNQMLKENMINNANAMSQQPTPIQDNTNQTGNSLNNMYGG